MPISALQLTWSQFGDASSDRNAVDLLVCDDSTAVISLESSAAMALSTLTRQQ